MFIVAAKDTLETIDSKPEKPIPTVLMGDGAFGVSQTPFYSPIFALILRNLKGMFCMANIRGGGEYGEEWHNQATKENK